MTPVHQDRFPDLAAGRRGNCFQAALATVLDLPLEAVPHFVQQEADTGTYWWTLAQAWLAERNLVLMPSVMWPQNAPYLQTGVSPRDAEIQHVVVCVNGQIVHDPHPDGTGLVENRDAYLLVALDPARAALSTRGA